MKTDILKDLRRELKQNTDAKTLEIGQRFFKEKIKFYGVKSNIMAQIGKKYFNEIKSKSKKEIFFLCEELFKTDYNEEAWIACDWVYAERKYFKPEDFAIFERWIEKYVNNWAKCDTLCNHTVGEFIEKYPEFIKNLKIWTKSKNRWLRRASTVALILPARKGLFLEDIFKIADILLKDQDDLVQKGYGWMLKEASKPYQTEVFDYIMKNKKGMPRTALRYAIEKMPKDLRAKAMEK